METDASCTDFQAIPPDVSDDEWSLVVPYMTLMKEDAPQHEYPLRELFNALRYLVRYGIASRAMPNDFPPWHAVTSRRIAGSRPGALRRWR
jgi:transposase